MTGTQKMRFSLLGLLAGTLALGIPGSGVAEAHPQDLLQQQGTQSQRSTDSTSDRVSNGDLQRNQQTPPQQDPLDKSGTGGSGDTGSLPRDEDALHPIDPTHRNEGTEGMMNEPGTGRTDPSRNRDALDESGTGGSGTRGANDRMVNEPGTGGSNNPGDGSVRNSNEGVLVPGRNDEGLDADQGQVDQDTYYQGMNPKPRD